MDPMLEIDRKRLAVPAKFTQSSDSFQVKDSSESTPRWIVKYFATEEKVSIDLDIHLAPFG